MANNQTNTDHTAIDELNDSITGIGETVKRNSKALTIACISLAAIVGAVLIYIYAVRMPGIQHANDAIGEADLTLALGQDSLALEQYKAVADEYGYDAGNRAKLQAAILLYQKGEYEQAISYLDSYKPTDPIIGASALALHGDCLVNLDKNEEALGYFRKAVKQSDSNPYYTPAFMLKEANVLRAMGNYKEEAAVYSEINTRFPDYGQLINADMEKYQRRAEMQAAE